MAKYRVKFEIECIVDTAAINVGEDGENVMDKLNDDQYNVIVDEALTITEGMGNNVISITKEEEEEKDPWDTDEISAAVYDDSPEYVHDAALDWLAEHAEDYEDRGDALWACKCALDKEGYHIFSNCECEWAVEDAFDDYDGEVGWE